MLLQPCGALWDQGQTLWREYQKMGVTCAWVSFLPLYTSALFICKMGVKTAFSKLLRWHKTLCEIVL